jgi:hypothetical protein
MAIFSYLENGVNQLNAFDNERLEKSSSYFIAAGL